MKNSALAESILAELSSRGETLASAESLTGGMIGALLTDVPGVIGELSGRRDQLRNASQGDACRGRPEHVWPRPVRSRSALLPRWLAASRHFAGPTGAWRQPAWPGLRLRTATRSGQVFVAVSYQTGELLGVKELALQGGRAAIRQQAALAALALLAEALGLNGVA